MRTFCYYRIQTGLTIEGRKVSKCFQQLMPIIALINNIVKVSKRALLPIDDILLIIIIIIIIIISFTEHFTSLAFNSVCQVAQCTLLHYLVLYLMPAYCVFQHQ